MSHDRFMDFIGYAVVAAGGFLVMLGFLALFAVWVRPSLLRSRVLGSRMFSGTLQRSRSNLMLLALIFVCWGAYLALDVTELVDRPVRSGLSGLAMLLLVVLVIRKVTEDT